MINDAQPKSRLPIQFHVLSFEGPDSYAQAGGISSRITGLTHALSDAGLETHLWFIGDPDLPGHEAQERLQLHRWCQWLSRAYPEGVYAGEDAKQDDYAASLPPFLLNETLLPHLQQGGAAAILAEEWHTAHAVLHLDWLLRQAGLRQQVTIFWNANNTFSFDRIDWSRLAAAAVITTVSRYMKHYMKGMGVEALVIPNGLSADTFAPPAAEPLDAFRRRFRDRTVVTKVARWDPDKRWLLTIDTIAAMKQKGWKPLFLARGGVEAHGAEVWRAAEAAGLRVAERSASELGARGLLQALDDVGDVDMVSLRTHIDPESRRVLFRGADAVLANSGHEPFGLVGLETMAAGGLACTGCSGEDYAIPGRNALVLETQDPWEFIGLFGDLRANPARERDLRRHGQRTAMDYAWPQIIRQVLLPRIQLSTPGAYAIAPRHRAWAPDERGGPLISATPASLTWLRHLIGKRHGAKLAAPSIMEGIEA